MPINYSHTPTTTVGDIQLVDFSDFRFRASGFDKLISAFVNDFKAPALTEAQTKDFEKLANKDNLTEKQEQTLQGFVKKIEDKENPVLELTQGTISELHTIWNKESLGIYPILKSKAVRRGILQEQESIDLVNSVFGIEMAKNTERLNNDYLTGEPDLITDLSVIDIKTCESWETFSKQTLNSNTSDYYWQLWVYSQLTKKNAIYIARTLPSYDNELITYEQTKAMTENEIDQIYFNFNFDRIPENKRVRVFKIQLNDEPVEIIYQYLDKCRDYLNNLNTWYLNMVPKVNF
jgi:hypothetical protein